jgi:hypothetical protein
MSYVGERPADPLTILTYLSEGNGEGWLYEDGGEGHDHEHGAFARTPITCRATGNRITVVVGARTGRFGPPRTSVHLELRGLVARPAAVLLNGAPVAESYLDGDTLLVVIPASELAQRVDLHGDGIVARP